jgi:hypothetical protein
MKKGSDEEEEKKSIRIGIKEKMRPEKDGDDDV